MDRDFYDKLTNEVANKVLEAAAKVFENNPKDSMITTDGVAEVLRSFKNVNYIVDTKHKRLDS